VVAALQPARGAVAGDDPVAAVPADVEEAVQFAVLAAGHDHRQGADVAGHDRTRLGQPLTGGKVLPAVREDRRQLELVHVLVEVGVGREAPPPLDLCIDLGDVEAQQVRCERTHDDLLSVATDAATACWRRAS
jgi:hypothetical protein